MELYCAEKLHCWHVRPALRESAWMVIFKMYLKTLNRTSSVGSFSKSYFQNMRYRFTGFVCLLNEQNHVVHEYSINYINFHLYQRKCQHLELHLTQWPTNRMMMVAVDELCTDRQCKQPQHFIYTSPTETGVEQEEEERGRRKRKNDKNCPISSSKRFLGDK